MCTRVPAGPRLFCGTPVHYSSTIYLVDRPKWAPRTQHSMLMNTASTLRQVRAAVFYPWGGRCSSTCASVFIPHETAYVFISLPENTLSTCGPLVKCPTRKVSFLVFVHCNARSGGGVSNRKRKLFPAYYFSVSADSYIMPLTLSYSTYLHSIATEMKKNKRRNIPGTRVPGYPAPGTKAGTRVPGTRPSAWPCPDGKGLVRPPKFSG